MQTPTYARQSPGRTVARVAHQSPGHATVGVSADFPVGRPSSYASPRRKDEIHIFSPGRRTPRSHSRAPPTSEFTLEPPQVEEREPTTLERIIAVAKARETQLDTLASSAAERAKNATAMLHLEQRRVAGLMRGYGSGTFVEKLHQVSEQGQDLVEAMRVASSTDAELDELQAELGKVRAAIANAETRAASRASFQANKPPQSQTVTRRTPGPKGSPRAPRSTARADRCEGVALQVVELVREANRLS